MILMNFENVINKVFKFLPLIHLLTDYFTDYCLDKCYK